MCVLSYCAAIILCVCNGGMNDVNHLAHPQVGQSTLRPHTCNPTTSVVDFGVATKKLTTKLLLTFTHSKPSRTFRYA